MVIYSGVIIKEPLGVHLPMIGENDAPNSVAQGTPKESIDFIEVSVSSQSGESEESDDDYEDIMDVASSTVDTNSNIETPPITRTFKRWKRQDLFNVKLKPPIYSLKTRSQRAKDKSVADDTYQFGWMLYSINNNLPEGKRIHDSTPGNKMNFMNLLSWACL
ncbi:hypothetical protein K7X08_008606 [Anisodus acutangulus]|uniref:Uncharacterized protein n=1 Tax=Anisodus acutangulus TaxID=402998 RepID=A0A9Q1RLJ3_9SOLA|nr:hypothetical protein K7X08_008606 [Anisodus acutangulus]